MMWERNLDSKFFNYYDNFEFLYNLNFKFNFNFNFNLNVKLIISLYKKFSSFYDLQNLIISNIFYYSPQKRYH